MSGCSASSEKAARCAISTSRTRSSPPERLPLLSHSLSDNLVSNNTLSANSVGVLAGGIAARSRMSTSPARLGSTVSASRAARRHQHGSITNTSADVAVTATGPAAAIGGLVGFNGPKGSIDTSQAHGNVTFNDRFPTVLVAAGGLVGINVGTMRQASSADGKCAPAHLRDRQCQHGRVGEHDKLVALEDSPNVGDLPADLIYLGGLVGGILVAR